MSKILARSKFTVFSTVLAVVLAVTSATSVFAASATAPSKPATKNVAQSAIAILR